MLSTIGSFGSAIAYRVLPSFITGATSTTPSTGDAAPDESVRHYTPEEKKAIIKADKILEDIFHFQKPPENDKPLYGAYCKVIYDTLHARPPESVSVVVKLPDMALDLELEQLPPDTLTPNKSYCSILLKLGEKKVLFPELTFRTLLERLNSTSVTQLFSSDKLAKPINRSTPLPAIAPDTSKAPEPENKLALDQSLFIQPYQIGTLFDYFLVQISQTPTRCQVRDHAVLCNYAGGKFYDFTFSHNMPIPVFPPITVSTPVIKDNIQPFICFYENKSDIPIFVPLVASRASGDHTVLLILFNQQKVILDPKTGFNLFNEKEVGEKLQKEIITIGLRWQSLDDGICSTNFTAEIFRRVIDYFLQNFGFDNEVPLEEQLSFLKTGEKPSICTINQTVNSLLKIN